MSLYPSVYLICYDISDPKRLRKVYKTMLGFGDRLQYSVFRCVLSDIQLARLRTKLSGVIHHREDQVLILCLGHADSRWAWRASTLGRALELPERGAKIV